MRKARLSEIQKFIERKGVATMQEICREFDIALSTARKDISDIAKEGGIQKIYGGAKAESQANISGFLTYERRANIDKQEKMLVAKQAAALVHDGDSIFLDSGTTTAKMIDFLANKRVTVFTSNVEILINSIKYENIELYFLGGKLNKTSFSTQQFWSMDHLHDFNINKAFMAASGYSINGGVTHASPWEYETKRFAVEKAAETYILITDNKIDKKTLVKYADAEEIKNVVTNKDVSKLYHEFFTKNHIRLHIAEG